MHLTPAQIAVRLICGGIGLPVTRRMPQDLCERVRMGHDQLVRITGTDFGYDLQAWHDYLKESRDGGYTYGRNVLLPKPMKLALETAEWQAAIRQLAASDSK